MTTFFGKALNLQFRPENEREWLEYLEKNDGKKVMVLIDRETGVRTPDQNSALHLYFENLASALNESGFPLKMILGTKTVELDWNAQMIKENVWRPIQVALTGKKSTTSLDKVSEIDKVYEHLNRFFSNPPFGLYVPFPSEVNKPKVGGTDIPYPVNNLEPKF